MASVCVVSSVQFLLLFTCRRSCWFALGFFLLWLEQLADRFAFRVWCVGPGGGLGASVRADVQFSSVQFSSSMGGAVIGGWVS